MLDFIFGDVFQTPYTLVDSRSDALLCYDYALHKDMLCIQAHGLLFESAIKEQNVEITIWKTMPVFFSNAGSDIPFDLFSAVFYLVSRYEEYLPYSPDEFNRYPHRSSLAFQQGFLKIPLVDIWLLEFESLVKQKTGIVLARKKSYFLPTYDIDIAYSYKGKSLYRNLAGCFLDALRLNGKAVWLRWKVLAGKSKDPYDAYDFLESLHQEYHLEPIYFFLLSDGGKLDKNLNPDAVIMKSLMEKISGKYAIGIHPSIRSHESKIILQSELQRLLNPTRSRQHYIRFALPDTYRNLLEAGIKEDYSMGYGSINGFRASTAHSFFWYDLQQDEQSVLRVHPFAFMECNTRYEQKQQAQDALDEMNMYWSQVQWSGGGFITIWHNFSLGSALEWQGWSEVYQSFLEDNF